MSLSKGVREDINYNRYGRGVLQEVICDHFAIRKA